MGEGTFLVLVLLFEAGFLCVAQAAWNSCCRPDWPQRSPASAAWVPSSGSGWRDFTLCRVLFLGTKELSDSVGLIAPPSLMASALLGCDLVPNASVMISDPRELQSGGVDLGGR